MTARRNSIRRYGGGFTLIEILIVVIILGVLSTIVIPRFSTGSRQAREATLKDCLRYLRAQIAAYKVQHNQVPPGYPNDDSDATPTATTFVAQMTQYTDDVGHVGGSASELYRWGPYLSDMPANPMTSGNGILVVTGPSLPAPDPSKPYAWVYNPQTQEIRANVGGADEAGTPYTSY